VILFGAREVREAADAREGLGRREVEVACVEFVLKGALEQGDVLLAGGLEAGEIGLGGAPLRSAATLPALAPNLPAGASGRPAAPAGTAPRLPLLSASASGCG
jgi:hypothetical protein